MAHDIVTELARVGGGIAALERLIQVGRDAIGLSAASLKDETKRPKLIRLVVAGIVFIAASFILHFDLFASLAGGQIPGGVGQVLTGLIMTGGARPLHKLLDQVNRIGH